MTKIRKYIENYLEKEDKKISKEKDVLKYRRFQEKMNNALSIEVAEILDLFNL